MMFPCHLFICDIQCCPMPLIPASNIFTFLIDSFAAFSISARTRISHSLQSRNISSTSFKNIGCAASTASHNSSSTDTPSKFAILTSVVRLTWELPVSMLLTCCAVTPTVSATVSCVKSALILAIFILLPIALKSSLTPSHPFSKNSLSYCTLSVITL